MDKPHEIAVNPSLSSESLSSRIKEIEGLIEEKKRSQVAAEDLKTVLDIEVAYLLTGLRADASRKFFLTYGEWDWVVRRKYIELVKSLSHTYPYSDDTIGYRVELWNFTPPGVTDDMGLEHPFILMPDPKRGLVTCTEFIKPEHIDQCKITPKILAAFKLLEYIPESKGRGFAIDRMPRPWGGESHTGDGGFDYEGYKWHLEEPVD